MAKDTRKLSIVVSVRDRTKTVLSSIGKRVKKFAAATSKAIGKAFKAGLAAAAGAFAVFTFNVKKQFDEIDQLAKDAFRFGVAIENMRGMELAANLAGLSLSELQTVMRDLGKRVSEAGALGKGRAFEALEALKLDPKELNAMGMVDQIDTVLAALSKVEKVNDRNRLAYDLMGRSGINAMTMMGSGLRSTIMETELLGTKLDDEIAGAVQDANDELRRVKEAFKGIVQVVVSELAPALEEIFKDTKQFLIDVRYGMEAMPLTLGVQLTKMKKQIVDFEKFILDNKLVTAFSMGDVAVTGLEVLSSQLGAQIADMEKQLDDLAAQGPGLGTDTPFEDPEERQDAGRRTPTAMPGITSGRLLTGAAQSSAERLFSLQKEADNKRAKEAADAAKQRDEQSKLLADLLRGAVQGSSNLGTLLQ